MRLFRNAWSWLLNHLREHSKAWMGGATAIVTLLGIYAAYLQIRVLRLEEDALDQRGRVSLLNEQIVESQEIMARDSTTIETLRDQVREQAETIREKDLEVSALRAQGPPVEPEAADIPTIRKSQEITLAVEGDSIDLNSNQANFGASDDTLFATDTVRYEYSNMLRLQGIDLLRLTDGEATYGTCSAASGYGPPSDAVDPSYFDSRTCLRLDSGRIATMRTTVARPRTIKLLVTTWELA